MPAQFGRQRKCPRPACGASKLNTCSGRGAPFSGGGRTIRPRTASVPPGEQLPPSASRSPSQRPPRARRRGEGTSSRPSVPRRHHSYTAHQRSRRSHRRRRRIARPPGCPPGSAASSPMADPDCTDRAATRDTSTAQATVPRCSVKPSSVMPSQSSSTAEPSAPGRQLSTPASPASLRRIRRLGFVRLAPERPLPYGIRRYPTKHELPSDGKISSAMPSQSSSRSLQRSISPGMPITSQADHKPCRACLPPSAAINGR
jgi:hypothetical protein